MAKKTEELVTTTKSSTAVIPASLPSWAGDAGSGMEGTDKDSFAIPFIRVLQQLSPQCTPGKTGYNPAAKAGMILNTVTGELVSGETGIVFVPCAFQRRFIQWAPRGSNGGYRGEHNPEDVAARVAAEELTRGDDGKLYIGEPNPKKSDYLSDTRNHFGLVLTPNGPVQALLSLTSTQIKKSKQLMGLLGQIKIGGKTPPTYLSKVRMTTVLEANDSGSWYGVRFEHEAFLDATEQDVYEAGKAFHDLIASNVAHVNYDEGTDAPADDSEWGEKA